MKQPRFFNARLNFRLRTVRVLRPETAISALLVLALSLSGCSEPPAPEQTASSRPVKLFTVDTSLGAEIRQFPATIEAATQAELSFRVSGQLESLPIREGEVVEAQQILAQLDATDFKNTLEDREAVFENTERNFRRAGELIGSGSISQLDYDRMEADFRSARAALAQAKADLSYATLRAPFRGRIARRYVDNFEEIRAKQSIVYLQDTELLDVIIAMPESVIRSVSSGGEDELSSGPLQESRAAEVIAMASFDNRPNISYALELKEVATRADPDTQTFPVTFSMRQPDEFTVLPGMTAQVEVDFSDLLSSEVATWVPARAVQADATLSPRVFVLDPETMQVQSLSVETGRVSGDMIEVLSGLTGGEEIVAVGASYLSDGMQVTRMAGGEQAVPREAISSDSSNL
ncbi:efflux RND transporter periplasmic adaptor subunit [Congregibacter variabilis]|uniref:Efflux RND transporter periplasmic adaptor subunit n=1 Tax=Congregibacter variabilis TaxID=3081200 RepID=A0ABZ0I3S1_9GAMM|nr:efflux RND transporter periplasmic adaptor subunit [Congregibacter sp. IMCC43200]